MDLTVETGDLLSIMGPSGSGKSTLINILGLLGRSTGGSYLLNGQDVSTMNDNALSDLRNANIGFVFQSFNLLPRLTAQENVALPLTYRGLAGAQRVPERGHSGSHNRCCEDSARASTPRRFASRASASRGTGSPTATPSHAPWSR